MKPLQILIIDLGSQYTQVIGRTLRELGVRSAILSPQKASTWLTHNTPKGIILSGGSASVHDKNAPVPPKNILKRTAPLLGICYGMQWLAKELGGTVTPHQDTKEYGQSLTTFSPTDPLLHSMHRTSTVWASHGDTVSKLPEGFVKIAQSKDTQALAGMAHKKRNIWGVQFHPEVTHSQEGKKLLENFLSLCKTNNDWKPKDIIESIRQNIRVSASEKKCIIGFSGGVDSTVLTAILAPVLKKNLLAVCIDTGALRHKEIDEIRLHAKSAGVPLKIVRASRDFQKALGSTTHAEVKRARFKKLYGKILEREAKQFGAHLIAQGTLATDLIESGKFGASDLIKTHHNVGHNWKLEELCPLQELFKYEVRALSSQLKLPKSVTLRQPFPGPGLFIRVIGVPAKPDKLKIVRWADAQVTDILKKRKIYHKMSQLVVGLNGTRTVGVKGDKRVYGYSIIVRGIKTIDFMTAQGYQIPDRVRREISQIITKHPKIVAVDFRETDKPPCTTELE